jgi:hypothetical protein
MRIKFMIETAQNEALCFKNALLDGTATCDISLVNL